MIEAVLSAPAMVAVFDPGDDRDGESLADSAGFGVENASLEQGEKMIPSQCYHQLRRLIPSKRQGDVWAGLGGSSLT